MDTTASLFTAALGLQSPWEVRKSSFNASVRRLDLQVGFKVGSRFPCPECKADGCPVHDTLDKEWRHLDFFQHQAYISAKVPRVRCETCGVKQVEVPWARMGSGFTLLLEALVLELARNMPIKAVSDLLGVDDKRIWRVLDHYVGAALDRLDLADVRNVGLDETSARKRHDYVTVFFDLDVRRMLFMADGKDAETVGDFVSFLTEHNGCATSIREVSSDMSPAFIKGVGEHLPNAGITFDRFHVSKVLGDALDKVRRSEWRKGEAVKGSRFALLKNPENLTARDREALAEIQARNATLAEAYRLKETFRDLYLQTDEHEARNFLKGWVACAHASGIKPMIAAANTIRRKWKGILRWFRTRITNAVMEGLNSLLQAAKRKARGYRTHRNFRLIAYLIAGKLDLQPAA